MSHPTGKDERGAYFYFDLLRWLAASLVVIEHWRDLSLLTAAEAGALSVGWQALYFATGFGAEAVVIFFVLSGFWITGAVERRFDRKDFWSTYLIDRLSRLLIVVVPALVLGGLLDGIGRFGVDAPLYRGLSGAVTLPRDIAPQLGFWPFLGNIFFLQTIAVPTFGSNGPLWSLANEFWYYVWFPTLLILIRLRKLTVGIAGLAVVVVAPHLLIGFLVWLMGSLLFYFDRRVPAGRMMCSAWHLLLAGSVVLVCMSLARLGLVPHAAGQLATGASFAVFAWVLLRYDPPSIRIAAPFARFGAEASFSLYVTHFPLLALTAAIGLAGGRFGPSSVWLVVFVGGYLLSFGFAWCFSRVTEKKTASLRNLLRKRLLAGSKQRDAVGNER